MRIFDYDSYKTFLTHYIEKSGRRGVISSLARAAGCTHSYLSQVLHGKPDLTPDQAWALTEHLSFSKDESDYFFWLVLSERAATQKLKKNLNARLKNLRTEQAVVSKAVSKSTDSQLKTLQRDRYYSVWSTGAIHSLTSCLEYQLPEALAKRLNLSVSDVENTLNWLMETGLVKRVGNRFLHSGESIHLPTDSIHNQLNHLNWRLRGIQNSARTEEIHYTSSFTISKDDWEQLKLELINFIQLQRKFIQSSGSDEGFAFCCDLFKI